MDIYSLFVKLTHPEKKPGWAVTTGYFTGETRQAVPKGRRLRGFYYHESTLDYKEYAIRFYVGEEEKTAWYAFHPAPMPDPEEIKGEKIRIRYKKSRPWRIEPANE